MYDATDTSFGIRLNRAIHRILYGDEQNLGLYRTMKGATDWGTFQRTVGQIEAYEAIQEEMQNIVRAMNEPPERK